MALQYDWSIYDGALASDVAAGTADTLEKAKETAMAAYTKEYGFTGNRVDLSIEGWEFDAEGHGKEIDSWIAGRSNEREGIEETFFQWRKDED